MQSDRPDEGTRRPGQPPGIPADRYRRCSARRTGQPILPAGGVGGRGGARQSPTVRKRWPARWSAGLHRRDVARTRHPSARKGPQWDARRWRRLDRPRSIRHWPPSCPFALSSPARHVPPPGTASQSPIPLEVASGRHRTSGRCKEWWQRQRGLPRWPAAVSGKLTCA